ncbi:hypothetical protein [Lysinibacillus sp. NPDC093688]|uniref:hypothetical protein n=1 Tax=Lysinibacillus sp. NPDC093688 TaxID=3390577 RepID=UPI003D0218EB
MKNMRISNLLSDSEIMDLLDGPQKMGIVLQKEEITELSRVVLRESLEKTVEVCKAKKDFESVEAFSNLLCNFDNITFFVELENSDSIVYSFECITDSMHYSFKDSGFFTLPK